MLLQVENIRKAYGGIVALDGAGMAVGAQTIHGLVGPNGAGKSTLMKIVSGQVAPDSGRILVAGNEVSFTSVLDAQAAGIVQMPQELTLAGDLTVQENIVMGVEPRRHLLIDRAARLRAAKEALETVGVDLDPDALVSGLRPSEQRMVMFAHALHRKARLLILDEPTAAMSLEEARSVLDTVRRLRERGVAVIYVSHRLDEILELCDEVTTLRDGRVVSTVPREGLTKAALVRALLGAEEEQREPLPDAEDRPVVLSVSALEGAELRGVGLEVRAGEVLGVAGLPGSGAGELLRMLGGDLPPGKGAIEVAGGVRRMHSPADALAAGISYLPGERKHAGFLELSLRVNVLASKLGAAARGGLIRPRRERRLAAEALGEVAVDPRTEAPLSSMSGGNQQRALVARSIAAGSRVIVLDDPMAGVDVGARAELHALLGHLARQGRAVVVGASEPDELAMFADRVAVLSRGRLVCVLSGEGLTPNAVLEATISDELATSGAAA